MVFVAIADRVRPRHRDARPRARPAARPRWRGCALRGRRRRVGRHGRPTHDADASTGTSRSRPPRRLAGPGPVDAAPTGRRRRRWPSCARTPTGRRPRCATSPAWTRTDAHGRRSLVVDRPGWIQANADGFADVIAPLVDKLPGEAARRRRGHRRGRLAGHRRRGRRPARLHVRARCSASSTRSTQARAGDGPGRLLLVAPNIVARRARARRRPARLPALGLPARGDPPGAVHRGARGCATTCSARSTSSSARRPRPVAGWPRCSATASSGSADARPRRRTTAACSTLFATPEQRRSIDRVTGVMSLLEGHADVVMDGVGPEVIPTRRRRSARSSTSAARASARLDRLLRRLLGLDAKMAQYRDGAAFVRARRRQGRHGRLQRGLGRPGEPARPRPRSATRRPGYAACTAEPCRDMAARTPPSRRSGSPYAAALAAPAAAAGSVLVACSRRAPTRSRCWPPTVFEAPPARPWQVGRGRPSTTGCRRARRSTPPSGRRRWRRWASTRPSTVARSRSDAAGRARGGRPGGAVRRARRGRASARRRRRAARPHPRRPGRDGAARAGPRLGRPLARRACAGRSRPLPPPAARRDPGATPWRPARPRASAPGTTRTTTTRASPGSGSGTGAAGARGRARPRGRGRRWPAPPTSCARTPTRSTSSPTRRGRAAARRRARRRGRWPALPAGDPHPGAAAGRAGAPAPRPAS